MSWWNFLLVSAGGASGALARWGLSHWVRGSKLTLGPYPIAILLVNALGCFLASRWTQKGILGQESWGLALGVGFLGAFTTLSALNLEVAEFVRAGQTHQAI